MTTQTLHSLPSRAAVMREQLRTAWLGTRPAMLLVAGLLLVFTGVVVQQRIFNPEGSSLDLVPADAIPMILVAFFLPLAVWRDETPSRRTYHLAMPVDRGWHQLARNASGWVWLMAAVAVYLVWVGVIAVISGGEVGVETMQLFTGADWETRTDADFRTYRWATPAWQWAVPFVAATAAYLLGSALVIGTDHPWRWGVGIWLVYVMAVMIADGTRQEQAERQLMGVIDGRYGVETLFSGETRQDTGIQQVRRGPPTVEVRTPDGTVQRMELNRPRDPNQPPSNIWRDMPDLGAWLGASAIWLGLGIVLVFGAAYRYRDT